MNRSTPHGDRREMLQGHIKVGSLQCQPDVALPLAVICGTPPVHSAVDTAYCIWEGRSRLTLPLLLCQFLFLYPLSLFKIKSVCEQCDHPRLKRHCEMAQASKKTLIFFLLPKAHCKGFVCCDCLVGSDGRISPTGVASTHTKHLPKPRKLLSSTVHLTFTHHLPYKGFRQCPCMAVIHSGTGPSPNGRGCCDTPVAHSKKKLNKKHNPFERELKNALSSSLFCLP